MSFVSLYAYINPVIAVALGVLVLHEPFTWRMAIAAALVFAGVAVVRWEQRPGDAAQPLRRPLPPAKACAQSRMTSLKTRTEYDRSIERP